MYLYAVTQDDRKLGGQRVRFGDMNPATTRALLEKHFPGARVLSPLEAKPAVMEVWAHRSAARLTVISVYGSRTKDGRSRCTQMEQWAIYNGDQEATPAEPAGRLSQDEIRHTWPDAGLSQDEIRHMAEHTRRWTYKYLIETTSISRPEAMQMAVDAANRYAEALGVEFCRCGTPIRNGVESNICRNCGNPIDQLLTGGENHA